jgi:4'-phosphopantetheinyl transferase
MVRVVCMHLPAGLPENAFRKLFCQLPVDLQEKNLRLQRLEDKWRHLAGKHLLKYALRGWGLGPCVLQQLLYNRYGRPYLCGDIDFNISHSGGYVLCATGTNTRLGIDIEEINPIDLSDFDSIMSPDQWEAIFSDKNSLASFYYYWTIKESVIKADSRGFLIPPGEIIIEGSTARYGNANWFLHKIPIAENYPACLATSRQCAAVEVEHVNLQRLMDN